MKESISRLVNWLSGSSADSAGEGVETTVIHTWPLPPSITLLFLISAAVLVVAVYARERGSAGRIRKLVLATMRIALIGLVVLMLYGWMLNRYRTDLPDIVVMIDDSASMAMDDLYEDEDVRRAIVARIKSARFDNASRFNIARTLMLEDDGRLLDELNQRYNLKLYRVGETLRAQSDAGLSIADAIRAVEPTQSSSWLGKGLRDVLEAQRGRPTAAVIVLTDGITTDGKSLSEVAEYARRKAVPLFLVGLGNDKPPRDLRLSELLVDDVAFVGDLINLDFKLNATGYPNRAVRLRLKMRDVSGGNATAERLVAEREVVIPEDAAPQSIRLSHRPEEQGEFEFTVEAETFDGEANTENNRLSRVVRVQDETIRVLYAQEYPSFEFRFLKSTLGRGLKRAESARAIELTTVLQEADLEYTELDEAATRVFPVRRDELFKYDVIIFGDVNPSFLSISVLENIAAFVFERGGGLILASGPRHTATAFRDTPLAPLFPIDLDAVRLPDPDSDLDTGFRPALTRLGLTSPQLQLEDTPEASIAIWRDLPELYWLLEAPVMKPGARVLLEHPTLTGSTGDKLPVVCMQFVGAGKVVFHATDETSRWGKFDGDATYFERYWLQTIRYLSRSGLLGADRAAEMTTDREQYRRGESVRLRVRFFDDRVAPPSDDGVTLVLERDGGSRRQMRMIRDDVNRGIFEGSADNLGEGRYHAWIAVPPFESRPPSVRFAVVAPPGEQARLEMDASDLRLAAKTSRGHFYSFSTADRLLDDLPRGRQVRIESLPPVPIWNTSLLAGLFVVLIVSEWLLRKRSGML